MGMANTLNVELFYRTLAKIVAERENVNVKVTVKEVENKPQTDKKKSA